MKLIDTTKKSVRNGWIYSLLVALIIVVALTHEEGSWYFVRTNTSGLVSAVLTIFGLIVCLFPARIAALERYGWHWLLGGILFVLGITASCATYRDKQENQRQMDALLAATRVQATNDDLGTLRREINDLRMDVQAVLTSIIDANGSTNKQSEKMPVRETQKKDSRPSINLENHISLGPAIVKHIHASQRRTISNSDNEKYALQLVLQTDVESRPTAFMVECDEGIDKGNFFVAGQPVLMQAVSGVQKDSRKFYFRFSFPTFSPGSPIIVTLFSKHDIKVIRVMDAI